MAGNYIHALCQCRGPGHFQLTDEQQGRSVGASIEGSRHTSPLPAIILSTDGEGLSSDSIEWHHGMTRVEREARYRCVKSHGLKLVFVF